VIVNGIQLAARVCVIIGVTVALLLVDPAMAFAVVVAFGGVYGTLYAAIRNRVTRSGNRRLELNKARHKAAQESLSGVKELKLYGLEPVALRQFSTSSFEFAERQASNAVLAQIPRYALETIAIGGVLLIVLYLLRTGHRLEDTLPVLGLYAFAAYRLLPAIQTVFAGLASLHFSLGSLDVLHGDLVGKATTRDPPPPPLEFRQGIDLGRIGFRYRGAARPTLDSIDLAIRPGEWVAFVGATGAGKSTLVDVILGLLMPSEGSIRVDDVPLDSDQARLAWQQNVAYVPQSIFLLDDSVVRNIAFGVPESNIDRERVLEAAQVAQIDGVIADLPLGLETVVGERGVRLSGGQRQRIGIARALYRRPNVIVLDEATSALDDATEARFFEALEKSRRNIAVISIAHRLTTTRTFDRIVVLDDGRIVDEGNYDELRMRSQHFSQSESVRGKVAAL
jgi:ABC-type multidrug transport system fused ATPase/permease subunit